MGAEAERSDTDSLDGRMKVEPRGTGADGFKRTEATIACSYYDLPSS